MIIGTIKREDDVAAEALAKEQKISLDSAREIVARDGVQWTWDGIRNRRLAKEYD